MQRLARRIRPCEVDQDVTQRDQFNSDEFSIAETLIRESHQNSLDGRGEVQATVRTRIALVEPGPEFADLWTELLEPLRPHLQASRLDLAGLDLSRPKLLILEDFGTTGLRGSYDRKDEHNFSDFWRRFGVSHKQGTSAGRWGLGKLVFSSASAIGTFFGVTVRDDDPQRQRLLMGQAVLNAHKLDGVDYAPHIFIANSGEDEIQTPEVDTGIVDQFVQAAGLTRRREPGLSIVVACANPAISEGALIPHVLSNYFFPILTGSLVVQVGATEISATTFDALATEHGDRNLSDGMIASFIRELQSVRMNEPGYSLRPGWDRAPSAQALAGALLDEEIVEMRRSYGQGELVSVRATLDLTRRDGAVVSTYVDLFLRKSPDLNIGQALYVRGEITIPGEARSFRGRGAFGALLASDRGINEFLGDAENPAHTKWIASADKLSKRWRNAATKVSAIRRVLNDLFEAISDAASQVDEDLLLDVFAVPAPARNGLKPPARVPAKMPKLPPARPKRFRIDRLRGGFAVRGNAVVAAAVPFDIDIQVAYAVRRGDAFKRFNRFDFDLGSPTPVSTRTRGAAAAFTGPNRCRLEVQDGDFEFVATGFDPERDLEIKAV